MKIVLLDSLTVNPGDLSWDAIAKLGEFTWYESTPKELRAERIGDAEAALVNKTHLDRATIEACPNLRYIGLFATGYNIVDVGAARERGIPVTNVPGYSTAAVAQHTLALLLEITNQVGWHDARVKEGMWSRDPEFAYRDMSLVELAGLTLGVIGYGGIGRAFARIAVAMGMKVVAYRKNTSVPPDPGVEYAALDTILTESDVVSLHVPLLPDTERMINGRSLSLMKRGAILVNSSRGGLIDDNAVAAALRDGKLAAYGADVASVEPVSSDNPLLGAPRCILTPHIAWAPKATRKRLMERVAENLSAFQAGCPVNVVN